ncbi:hypothetical protein AB4305_08435 [Nocardia sp. 2YAB30]|uniref:hypothetical protein n=1 Tax=unclassified Nocardia TaxID=2637762 RepID=UPI003F9D8A82
MTVAAVAQLLIALAFVSIPVVRHRYGAAAKAAAEAELVGQGVRPTILEENKMRFDAGGHETAVPLIMTVVAALELSGNYSGTVLAWVFQPLVFLGNAVILYTNRTAAKGVQAAFGRKGDPMLAKIDVRALLAAAEGAFPRWVMPYLQNVRHAVVFGGSILVFIALLAS